jgi:MOSC domain-containing protein YiiM
MGQGTVEGLFIAERESGPVRPVGRVRAVAGRGLEGDRYFAATAGPWMQDGEGRDVTLIEAEALEGLAADTGIELAPGASRRQVVTRGIALNDLVGRRFRLGDVDVVGRELANPCRHLEKLTQDGVLKGLVNRGGLRAEILTDGEIAVGDPVAIPDADGAGPA